MTNKDIAARIKVLRKKAGLTQAQLGDKAGLHENTVLFLETGRTKAPGLATIIRLAGALGYTMADLAGDDWQRLESVNQAAN